MPPGVRMVDSTLNLSENMKRCRLSWWKLALGLNCPSTALRQAQGKARPAAQFSDRYLSRCSKGETIKIKFPETGSIVVMFRLEER